MRQKVWAQQPAEFFAEARVDMDGTLVATTGECKAGMDIAYNGTWGYHPLVVSLANTGEVLSIVNRSGNRPSHEGGRRKLIGCWRFAWPAAFAACWCAGTRTSRRPNIWTAGTTTPACGSSSAWIAWGNCTLADDLPEQAWKPLVRPARYQVKTQPRGRRRNVKERIVDERQFQNIRWKARRWPSSITGRRPVRRRTA